MRDVIDVTQLNGFAKAILAADARMNDLIVCGEVTNFKKHYASGHCYFTLRDKNSTVKCVMFSRSARILNFTPEDGMMVLAYGSASIYERDGSFQYYVDYMRPYGVGAAQKAFDQLKTKLEKEGLFDEMHKKPLPEAPSCVGVVTSATGAALQDIKNIMSRRWPSALLLLAPVNVQGLEAEDQIIAGIRALDKDKRAQVIIVARGGGSREDLWVFNSERIARTAFACKTPLVSAVGHEIDYTILDYVADLRAPTPSAAAELCVPNREELIQKLCKIQQNIQDSMQSRINLCYNKLSWLQAERQKAILMQKIAAQEQRLNSLKSRSREQIMRKEEKCRARLSAAAGQMESLSPYHVLARGYVMLQKNGRTLRAEQLSAGDHIRLCGNAAEADCLVQEVFQKESKLQ